jgi:hypothetical protein
MSDFPLLLHISALVLTRLYIWMIKDVIDNRHSANFDCSNTRIYIYSFSSSTLASTKGTDVCYGVNAAWVHFSDYALGKAISAHQHFIVLAVETTRDLNTFLSYPSSLP